MSNMPPVTERGKEARAQWDENGIDATRTFDVVARSPIDALRILAREYGITQGSVYRNPWGEVPDPSIVARNISVVSPHRPPPIGGTGMFEILVSYSQKGRRQPEPVVGGKPIYDWKSGLYQAEADTDRDGKRITNTAGQTVRVPVSIVTAQLEVKWYVREFPPPKIIRCANAVNAVRWQGCEPGQIMCMGIDPSPESDELVLVTAHFEAREIGWQPIYINEGMQELIRDPQGAAGEPGDFGADGVKGASWPSPQPLDAQGKRLKTGEPIMLRANVYKEVDFAQELGI